MDFNCYVVKCKNKYSYKKKTAGSQAMGTG